MTGAAVIKTRCNRQVTIHISSGETDDSVMVLALLLALGQAR
jgi:hypothetical protein